MIKQKSKLKKTEIGMIPEDWEVKTISQVAEVVGGGTPSTKNPEYWNGKISWLTPKDLSNYKFKYIEKGERSITEEGLKNSSAKLLPKNTVLLTTRAPVGYVAISSIEVCTNQGFRSLIPKTDETDHEFLYYLLKLKTDYLKSQAFGSTFGELSGTTLKNLKFAFPPLPEQRAIAKILSDLDAKIELLQNQNKTLEAIGQAIFKHWFVDFEFPINFLEKSLIKKGKKPKGYKSSGGEMVYNEELGKKIPKGWRVGKLGEIGKIQPGFAFKSKDFLDKGIGLIKIKNIQPPIINFDFESFLPDELYKKIDNKFYLYSGDVLIAMTGAKIGKIGIIPKTNRKLLLNQRVGKVVSENKWFFYLILNSREIQGLIKGGSSASSAQGNISNSDIENFSYIVPDNIFLEKISKFLNTFFNKIVDNLGQIQTLSQIRDSLLPRLMSGKIRVPVEVGR